jgi:AraC-like DNA-binding protein
MLCELLPYPPDDPIWNIRYNLIMFQIFTYLLFTGYYFFRERDPSLIMPYKIGWYKFVIGSVALIWLSYAITWWIGILPYLSGTFIFCLFIYILIYLWLNKKQINESFEKYRNSILTKSDSLALFQKLSVVMKNTKPFLDNGISLSKLAFQLETKPHLLSQVINENFNTNFFDFINSCRIDEIKERLISPEYLKFTIAAIAYDCGFNSISSFNSAFKKKEKISPRKYREEYLL